MLSLFKENKLPKMKHDQSNCLHGTRKWKNWRMPTTKMTKKQQLQNEKMEESTTVQTNVLSKKRIQLWIGVKKWIAGISTCFCNISSFVCLFSFFFLFSSWASFHSFWNSMTSFLPGSTGAYDLFLFLFMNSCARVVRFFFLFNILCSLVLRNVWENGLFRRHGIWLIDTGHTPAARQ